MSELIQESNGRTSSMRVMSLVVVAVIMGLVAYCTVTGKPLPEISVEYVGLLGVGLGAKVWQKAYEK